MWWERRGEKEKGSTAVSLNLGRQHAAAAANVEESIGDDVMSVIDQPHLVVAAKVDIEIESGSSYDSFKSLDPGAFNVGFIGLRCSALP